MYIKEFMENVTQKMEKALGGMCHVDAEEVIKNNGIVCHGVIVRNGESNVSPCIYADGIYEEFSSGEISMADAAEKMLHIYRENQAHGDFDAKIFADYGNVRRMLRGCLVNTRRNRKLLEDVPHREFLDLSLIYRIEVCGLGTGVGTIRIHNGHLGLWGVGEEDLFAAVLENMAHMGDATFESMSDVVKGLAGMDLCGNDGEEFLYVLSNKNRLNGAVQMLNKHMLELASDRIGEDFIILPSSVHELLLVPDIKGEGKAERIRELADIVREVNDTQVTPCDILSYHVYRYEKETGKLAIVA